MMRKTILVVAVGLASAAFGLSNPAGAQTAPPVGESATSGAVQGLGGDTGDRSPGAGAVRGGTEGAASGAVGGALKGAVGGGMVGGPHGAAAGAAVGATTGASSGGAAGAARGGMSGTVNPRSDD